MGCGASTAADNGGKDAKKKKSKRREHGDRDTGSHGSAPMDPVHPSSKVADSGEASSEERDSLLSSISELDEGAMFPTFTPTHLKNIEEQREESSAFNIETEYFIWDDASLDLKEMRNRDLKKSFVHRKHSVVAGVKPMTQKPAGDGSTFKFNDFAIDPEFNEDWLAAHPLTSHGSMKRAPTQATVPAPAAPVDDVSARTPSRSASRPKPAKRTGAISNFKLTTLVGHSSRVKCIAVAPTETEYVSCSNEDSLVTYYDMRSGAELGIFSGHQDTVIFACFSPCGKFLATTSRDNTLMLWDVVTQKVILTFEHSKVVICCSFSKDSKLIATGCQDKVCRLWETRKGRELLAFTQHEGIIISLSFSPDEAHIVSCSADKTLRMWTTTKGRCKHTMRGHSAIILSCQYSVDGKKIVSNDERLTKVWNAADGNCLLTLNVDQFVTIRNMPPTKKLSWTLSCTCPGRFAKYFVVACNNRFVFVVDMDTGKEELCVDTKAPVYCLSSGHNSVVAFGDSFGNVYNLRLFGFPEEPSP